MKKIALITGATSGIGLACAEKFAANDYNLILTGRRSERLQELKDKIEKNHNVEVLSLNFDIREKKQVVVALESMPPKWKNTDVLVNNAGLALSLNPIQDGDYEDWETMIDTNIKGLLYISKIIGKQMANRGKGHIINIGSIAGKESYANGNVYCATKHAVDGLTRAMRIDLLPFGVKVSQVAPGAVETEFSEVRFKGDIQRARNVYVGYQPLAGSDVAESVYFVASQPPHVNINDLLIMPAAQANATTFHKNS